MEYDSTEMGELCSRDGNKKWLSTSNVYEKKLNEICYFKLDRMCLFADFIAECKKSNQKILNLFSH